MTAVRSLLAVVAGCIAALIFAAFTVVDDWLFVIKVPPGFDLKDPASIAVMMAKIPPEAIARNLLEWLMSVAIASGVSARFAPRRPIAHGLITGVVMLTCYVAAMLSIPHPIWWWAFIILFSPIAAILAAKCGARRSDDLHRIQLTG